MSLIMMSVSYDFVNVSCMLVVSVGIVVGSMMWRMCCWCV